MDVDTQTKDQLVSALRELGNFIALTQGGGFKAKAYERAAKNLAVFDGDLAKLAREDSLTTIPGIGPGIAARIAEFLNTGTLRTLAAFRKDLGDGAAEIATLTGLSPAKLNALHEAIGLSSKEALLQAAREQRVRKLKGFGAKSEQRLIEKLTAETVTPVAAPRAMHRHEVEVLQNALQETLSVAGIHSLITGEWRRAEELPSRAELVAGAKHKAAVRRALKATGALSISENAGVLDARFIDDMQARVHLAESLGYTQAMTTGTKKHTTHIEHALHGKPPPQADDDEALYAQLRVPWVPPELRHDDAPKPPKHLLTLEDIRGAVHCHSTYSDGGDSIADMARAAERNGLSYITLTDHSPTAHYAGGVTLDRLKQQWEEIDRVQETTKVRILRGCEADILKDGAIDYPDRILERFDVIIASIHQRYRLDRAAMTKRVITAMKHPLFKIWGHPLGRLLTSRAPIEVDLDEILDVMASHRCAIELNGDPYRLDLPVEFIRPARKRGIRFVISSDAHSTSGVRAYRHAVAMARRAGLTPADVLNTFSASDFAAAVRPRGARHSRPHHTSAVIS